MRRAPFSVWPGCLASTLCVKHFLSVAQKLSASQRKGELLLLLTQASQNSRTFLVLWTCGRTEEDLQHYLPVQTILCKRTDQNNLYKLSVEEILFFSSSRWLTCCSASAWREISCSSSCLLGLKRVTLILWGKIMVQQLGWRPGPSLSLPLSALLNSKLKTSNKLQLCDWATFQSGAVPVGGCSKCPDEFQEPGPDHRFQTSAMRRPAPENS